MNILQRNSIQQPKPMFFVNRVMQVAIILRAHVLIDRSKVAKANVAPYIGLMLNINAISVCAGK